MVVSEKRAADRQGLFVKRPGRGEPAAILEQRRQVIEIDRDVQMLIDVTPPIDRVRLAMHGLGLIELAHLVQERSQVVEACRDVGMVVAERGSAYAERLAKKR